MPLQLMDTNIFLEIELEQEHADACKVFLRKVASGEQKALFTDFALDAVLVITERNGKSASGLRRLLTGIFACKGLAWYSFTPLDKLLATQHMEEFSLDFDDSLMLQAMKANGITEIVSLDAHFDKIKGIKRIIP